MHDWLRWVLVSVFLAAAAEHETRAPSVNGAEQFCLQGHALMGVGMAYMFLPGQYRFSDDRLWEILFVAAAVLTGALALGRLRRRIGVDVAWILLFVDLAAMAYIWMMENRAIPQALYYLAVVWFSAEAVGWFSGKLCQRTIGWSDMGERSSPAAGAVVPSGRMFLPCVPTPLTRLNLGLMAVGMAYMFVAMHHPPSLARAPCG